MVSNRTKSTNADHSDVLIPVDEVYTVLDASLSERGMKMVNIWHNPKSTSHKTLVIQDDRVYVGSAGDDTSGLEDILASGHSPLPRLGEKAVELGDTKLTCVESEESSLQITIRYIRDKLPRYTMVDLSTTDERDSALDALRNALSLETTMIKATPVQAAKSPIFALILIGAGTLLLSNAAAELADGGEASISGRRSGLKRLFVFILDTIGPIGVYVIGGIAVFAAVLWLVRQVSNPPVTTTLTPSS